MRQRPRKSALILIGAVLALVLAECVLQGLAFALWLGRERLPEADADTPTILCVGDSFTYGLGAHDRSRFAYPTVLARELSAREGGAPVVVNAGRPGFDSTDVLAQLPRHLATYRPLRVVVLVGYNDFWAQGEVPAPPDDSFPLQFRLGKLARLVWAGLFGADPENDGGGALPDEQGPTLPQDLRQSSAAPFLGPWHEPTTGTVLEFLPDGSVHDATGVLDLMWTWTDAAILVSLPGGGDQAEIAFRLADDRLYLSGGPFPVEAALLPGLPMNDDLDRARAAQRAGDFGVAVPLFEAATALPGGRGAEARRGLIRALHRDGRDPSQIDRALAPLVTSWQTGRGLEDGRRLAETLFDIDRAESAVEVLSVLLRETAIDDALLQLLINHGGKLADPSGLLSAIDDASRREDLSMRHRTTLLGCAQAMQPDDRQRVARSVVALLMDDEERPALDRALAGGAKDCRPEEFAAALDFLGVSADRRTGLLRRYEAMRVATEDSGQGLAVNLAAIVGRCREASAEPLLLTYPRLRGSVQEAVESVAAAQHVEWIDLHAEFRRRVGADYDALFVLDGHCNDRGYELMGRIVAEALAAERPR